MPFGRTPSPLVGESGEIERSEMKPGEFASAERTPSSGSHLSDAADHNKRRSMSFLTRSSVVMMGTVAPSKAANRRFVASSTN